MSLYFIREKKEIREFSGVIVRNNNADTCKLLRMVWTEYEAHKNTHSNILISVALVNSGKGSPLYGPGAHSALQRKKSPS